MLKKLLTITAIFEFLTGISLIIAPGFVADVLFGRELLGAVALTVARITGVALISLAICCWLSRQVDAKAILIAMLFYNVATTSVLIYAKFNFGFQGIGLMPAVLIHIGLGAWCFLAFRK